MLRRTYKYRLYPTRRQERLLIEQLRFTRELYNAALEQRIAAYRLTGRSPSHLEQSREFTLLRRGHPDWLPEGMSRSAQQYALRRLELAFQGSGGLPRSGKARTAAARQSNRLPVPASRRLAYDVTTTSKRPARWSSGST